ncbi:hypothetical protein AAMO2058_001099100 [Amorphochlora amoebiformis]
MIEDLNYTFRRKPFGLRIQEPGTDVAVTTWQIVGISNPELTGKLIPGTTTLIKIDGKPPPTRFHLLADLLKDAKLPLTMTFRISYDKHGSSIQHLYSSSEDPESLNDLHTNPSMDDSRFSLPVSIGSSLTSSRSSISRKDRFLNTLRLRDNRRKLEDSWKGSIEMKSFPELDIDEKLGGGDRKPWEYEDVLEIMRLGGVHVAFHELEKMYRVRHQINETKGLTPRSKATDTTSGWRRRVARMIGKIEHFGGRRALTPNGRVGQRVMWKRTLKPVEKKKDSKRLLKLGENPAKAHHRGVTFGDTLGLPLVLGPTDAKASRTLPRLIKKTKSALKSNAHRESFDQYFKRLFEEQNIRRHALLEKLKMGAILLKFDSQGRPAKRWFCVSSDGTELYYSRRKPKAMVKKHARDRITDSISTLRSRAESFRSGYSGGDSKRSVVSDVSSVTHMFEEDKEHDKALKKKGLFTGGLRRYYTADIVEQHLGPWICGIRDKRIVPWRFFTLKFPDRVLNLQCCSESEMDDWYLGLQALSPAAPLNALYLTRGRFLWKRLIMKIEFYGIETFRQLAITVSSPSSSRAQPPHTPINFRQDNNFLTQPPSPYYRP